MYSLINDASRAESCCGSREGEKILQVFNRKKSSLWPFAEFFPSGMNLKNENCSETSYHDASVFPCPIKSVADESMQAVAICETGILTL